VVCAAQLGLGDAYVVGCAAVKGARGRAGGIARDGEGLECDGFEISLRAISTGHTEEERTPTIACALVLQVLRNSIREGGSLWNAQVVLVSNVQSRTGAQYLHQHRSLPSTAREVMAVGEGATGRRMWL
jgi:hypothetical protein